MARGSKCSSSGRGVGVALEVGVTPAAARTCKGSEGGDTSLFAGGRGPAGRSGDCAA